MEGGCGTDEGFHDQFGFEGSDSCDGDAGLNAFMSVGVCGEGGEGDRTFAVP